MDTDKKTIQSQIDFLTRELKDCEDDKRYEILWEERRKLLEKLNK